MKRSVWIAAVLFLAGTGSVLAQTSRSSMENLLASGQSIQCSYVNNEPEGTQSGTLYITSNRMRGDFDVQSVQGTYPMHMIREGNTSYMWGGPMGETMGMKMDVSTAAGRGPQQGPDMTKEMEFDCQPWNVDASKFEIPANVEFQDMGAMMGQLQAMMASASAGQSSCAACDQAPPDSRQACLEAMGCA